MRAGFLKADYQCQQPHLLVTPAHTERRQPPSLLGTRYVDNGSSAKIDKKASQDLNCSATTLNEELPDLRPLHPKSNAMESDGDALRRSCSLLRACYLKVRNQHKVHGNRTRRYWGSNGTSFFWLMIDGGVWSANLVFRGCLTLNGTGIEKSFNAEFFEHATEFFLVEGIVHLTAALCVCGRHRPVGGSVCVYIYRFSEPRATRDRMLTQASPLCSRANARFVHMLPYCSLCASSCSPPTPSCSLAAPPLALSCCVIASLGIMACNFRRVFCISAVKRLCELALASGDMIRLLRIAWIARCHGFNNFGFSCN